MSHLERLVRLKNLFDSGRCVPRQRLLTELGVSPATLKRDLAYLRDRMNAPVVWDKALLGYRLDAQQPVVGIQYELPGLWLSAEEIHALLTMQHLLANLDAGGLLGPHINPLLTRLGKLLDSGAPSHAEVARRIRVQTVGARQVHVPHFQAVGSALLRRGRRYLQAGILAHGEYSQRADGTPQGGPLSPLLANVMRDEVDRALERRGHRFVRYADDCNVWVRSLRAGQRVLRTLRACYAKRAARVGAALSRSPTT